jgi:hypothetical protein
VLPEVLVPDGRDEDDVEPEPVPLVEPEALVLPAEFPPSKLRRKTIFINFLQLYRDR